jgi:hypothetical protein
MFGTGPARGLRWCGAAAGPLFVSVFLVEGARRPDYRPRRHPVSSLALGPRGWVQTTNFTVTGLLYLAGAAGLARSPSEAAPDQATPDRTPAAALSVTALGLTGLGLLGAAAFRTDPVSGYPPGTPATPAPATTVGKLHTAAAVPVFLGLPAVALACAWTFHRRGRPGWAAYSAATAATMLASTGVFGAGFSQDPRFVDRAGLFQRVAIVTGLSWLTALSLRRTGR